MSDKSLSTRDTEEFSDPLQNYDPKTYSDPSVLTNRFYLSLIRACHNSSSNITIPKAPWPGFRNWTFKAFFDLAQQPLTVA